MKLFLSPIPGVCTTSYMDMFLYFKTLPEDLETALMNDFVYSYPFVHKFFRILDKLHPTCSIQVNSFLQEYTFKKLLNCGVELSIVTTSKDVSKYFSGNCYEALYKRLKKEKYQVNLISDPDTCVDSKVSVLEMINIALFLKKLEENDMGGLSNLIKAASEDLRKKDKNVTSESKLTDVMKDMGLDLDTGESFMNPPVSSNKNKKIAEKPESKEEKVEEDAGKEDGNDICYKIDGNKMVILIPEDTPIETVVVDGIKFKRLLTEIPRLDTTNLQILPVLNDSEKIVRVPIFLKKSDNKTTVSKTAVKSKETKKSVDDDIGGEDLEYLKQQKHDLDEKIAEARKDGDNNLVSELRKQRRKVRNLINKLSA